MTDERRPTQYGSSPGQSWVRHSRRRFLRAAAAAGTVAAVGTGRAQEQADYILGGVTAGWEGRQPSEIDGETNPTLTFQEGETYVLDWRNGDGQPHNFVIEDADGNAIVQSEIISEQGATQTVEFDATSEMAEYYCEVHPSSMRGDVQLGGGTATETGTETPTEGQGFFPEGPSVGVSTVADGMTAPTDFAMLEDGRMYVADQTGELWLVEDGERQSEPVLNVSDRMVELGQFEGSYAEQGQAYDERGLLGVEPHPEFADNGRLFVHYSAPPNDETPDGWSHVEVVSEFAASDAGSVDTESETVLMEFQKPQYNHDAGPMAFGPDGYLYVPMGDGGGANDNMYGHVEDWYDDNEGGNAQDTEDNLLGSVHRIDVDSEGEDGQPYAIPDDNPLVDMEGHLPEHYAWGFRNPFGISFDSEGRMFVADAGQNLFEEASIVERGGNYGWNVKEGTHCFDPENPTDPPEDCPDETPSDVRGGEELIDPIVEYPHTYQDQSVGIVVVGGHVYEAGDIDELQGGYIFGDWTSDPARASPDGRIFLATDPEENGGGGTATSTPSGDAQVTEDGTETPTDGGTATGTPSGGGTETPSGDDGQSPGETVPRDELWDMSELVIEGSENGSLNRFVRMFGQGNDGQVYVLVNTVGVPEGDTGAVLELVPPGEGEELAAPEGGEGGTPTGTDGTTTPTGTDGEGTPTGNATNGTGNATNGTGNATNGTGNETNGTGPADGEESPGGADAQAGLGFGAAFAGLLGAAELSRRRLGERDDEE